MNETQTVATTPGPDLEPLWRKARDGDERAFEDLYRATEGTVYGLCLRMTANRTNAEECTQRTFVQVWRKLGEFRGDSAFTTWLHRVTVNEVLGAFRAEQRHASGDDGLDEIAARPSDVGANMDLERAIATLPPQARQVFVLFGVYGYGHEETAAMLGIASGTSKAHYHRARTLLRAALDGGSRQPHGGNPPGRGLST